MPINLKEGCEWTQMILQPLKSVLKGAKFDFTDTGDNSMLLTHLEQELLPICDNCRSYRFEINLCGHTSAKKFIRTVLQFGQIDCCSNVSFIFNSWIDYYDLLFELPVDVVTNWLNRSRNSNAIDAKVQIENERILTIKIYLFIGNVSEVLNCLKKVDSSI